MKVLWIFIGLSFLNCVWSEWRPVVMMHGIGANAASMDSPVKWISLAFPGIYIKNVEIGDGYWDTFFLKMSDQVDNFYKQVKADLKLASGFNLIGYSQGGLVTRGYVQRYNDPPVYNYITWSAPHGGEFGIPEAEWTWVFRDIWEMMYDTQIQDHVSFAQYWRDPYDLKVYLEKSIFLADLNNEKAVKNTTYQKNIKSLNNLVLIYSTIDEIIIPPTSGWFQSFAPNNDSDVIPLHSSALYNEDWLGLKYLDQNKKLQLYSCACRHQDYPHEICHDVFNKYTLPYLNNTLQ